MMMKYWSNCGSIRQVISWKKINSLDWTRRLNIWPTAKLENMCSHDWLKLAQMLHNYFKKKTIGAKWSGVRHLEYQVFNNQKNESSANQHKLANYVKGGP